MYDFGKKLALNIMLFENLVFLILLIPGKNQVAIGMVALDAKHRSSQSAKSVYPLAIANCKEKRSVELFLYLTLQFFLTIRFEFNLHAVNNYKVNKHYGHIVMFISCFFVIVINRGS